MRQPGFEHLRLRSRAKTPHATHAAEHRRAADDGNRDCRQTRPYSDRLLSIRRIFDPCGGATSEGHGKCARSSLRKPGKRCESDCAPARNADSAGLGCSDTYAPPSRRRPPHRRHWRAPLWGPVQRVAPEGRCAKACPRYRCSLHHGDGIRCQQQRGHGDQRSPEGDHRVHGWRLRYAEIAHRRVMWLHARGHNPSGRALP